MEKFDLIVFDIDGTLARSKLPPDAEMAGLLCQLMSKYTVAIISGANYKQFKSQILDSLPCSSEHMKNLYILPVDGTVFCYGDGWRCENDAPLSTKEKRERMINVLKRSLPGFSMRIGGTTSIEVTKAGIDKAYGLKKLMERAGVSKEKILYVGDKLFKGGNDAPVLTLGIECRTVKNPEETKKIIMKLLK